jgi:hypothetical protein
MAGINTSHHLQQQPIMYDNIMVFNPISNSTNRRSLDNQDTLMRRALNKNPNNSIQIKETDSIKPKSNDKEDDCVVCWESKANMIFAPCAHKCCCSKDAYIILETTKICPMCRQKIEGVINVVQN